MDLTVTGMAEEERGAGSNKKKAESKRLESVTTVTLYALLECFSLLKVENTPEADRDGCSSFRNDLHMPNENRVNDHARGRIKCGSSL